MSTTGTRHLLAVDAILRFLNEHSEREDIEDRSLDFDELAFARAILDAVPDITAGELKRAQDDADGIWQERVQMTFAEAREAENYAALFDDMPEGTSLAQAAQAKAQMGDPFAEKICRQLGGNP